VAPTLGALGNVDKVGAVLLEDREQEDSKHLSCQGRRYNYKQDTRIGLDPGSKGKIMHFALHEPLAWPSLPRSDQAPFSV
jgi:hypothetical protein